jgi:hypothetical protein
MHGTVGVDLICSVRLKKVSSPLRRRTQNVETLVTKDMHTAREGEINARSAFLERHHGSNGASLRWQ